MLIKYTGKYVNIYFIMKITFSVYFTTIYVNSKDMIFRKYSLYIHSCSLFRPWL